MTDSIRQLAEDVLAGHDLPFDSALELVRVEGPDLFDLMAWANRIRTRFLGNKVHLCSIVNAKSGGCSEDCSFCSQASRFHTAVQRYSFIDSESALSAAADAGRNGAQALGLVAAWRGLREGPQLDEVCERIREVSRNGAVRADASLGLIDKPEVAVRLREAGLSVYNHNLETARSFYSNICSTHSYDDRLKTLEHVRSAGIKVCCGGIVGMGETWEQRVELAFELRSVDPEVAPLNFLNPITGTPLEERRDLTPLDALKTISIFRFVLPRTHIMVAGGREVNLRSLQPMMFLAGASAAMVGNYLTTPGQDPDADLQMIRDLGLEYDWNTDWAPAATAN